VGEGFELSLGDGPNILRSTHPTAARSSVVDNLNAAWSGLGAEGSMRCVVIELIIAYLDRVRKITLWSILHITTDISLTPLC
jgi:hypothetical protein